MKHLHLRAAAAFTAATTAGLLGLVVPSAHAAGTASRVTSDKKVAFHLTAAGKARVDAGRGAVAGADGAVTLLNNSTTDASFALAQGSTSLGSSTVPANSATFPQILPAGSYTLTVTPSGTTTTPVTTETFTVVASQDNSEAYYATVTGAAIQDTVDAVSTVQSGAGVLSFRNESPAAGAVDVYVNGTKVLTNVAVGASADVAIAAGNPQIGVDKTGTTVPVIASSPDSAILAAPDAYDALYLLTATGGSTPFTFALNTFDQGYAFAAADGGTFNYGSFPFQGSLANIKLNKPVVGGAIAAGEGDYLVASDGGVFAFNGAPFLGSTGNIKLAKPIVGMATTDGTDGTDGYLLVASDGGVFAYNTPYYGSLGGQDLPAPVVGVTADPTTGTYYLALGDGIVQEFGPSGPDVFAAPAPNLAKPIVGISLTPDARGFWLVASDGGVFAGGDADFFGSTGNIELNQPVTGIVPSYDGLGYSLIAKDGGVFSYGDSHFYGSTGNINLAQPVVGPIAIP